MTASKHEMKRRNLIKSRIFIVFLIYGIVIGCVSVFWSRNSDLIYLLNAPPLWFGDTVYAFTIENLGSPYSPHAQLHDTVDTKRIPQVYFLTSVAFWSLLCECKGEKIGVGIDILCT
ncbi:hypothetical protein DRP04_13410 [Archaeoglobales archaeon]|nr:MAG: hypothetical protein DRP04_13410 [Archaeoglobales archaeon]